MIIIDELIYIIEDQALSSPKSNPIIREVEFPKATKRIIIVAGVRRCGKSTLLHHLHISKNKVLALNFEDPRLEGFNASDFDKIDKICRQKKKQYLLFDEIQNIAEWELGIRSLNDKGYKIYITGSNASMLSRELGTRLTGRYKQLELFPFSYGEYLNYFNEKANLESINNYLRDGGFPEFLFEKESEYLRTLLRDIIMRDIAVRKDIRNEHFLIRLAIHIFSNIGKEFSFNNITKLLEIKSVRTTIDYCDYLQECYLIEMIPRFSFSIKQQLANPKKAYCIDTAMAKANSLSFNEDYGRLLENAVFLHIRRAAKEIYYFKNDKAECDFIIKESEKVILSVQVCSIINNDNVKRELEGIRQSMKETGSEKGIIITLNQEDEIDGIPLIPAWKWMVKPFKYGMQF